MIEPAPGILLIADPFLKDPNFLRTVVILCEKNEEGAVGFVLNRQYEHTLDELLPDLEGHDFPVYFGGPVQPETIHMLHQCPDQIPGGQEILEGVYWGGDFEAVIDLLHKGELEKDRIRFFLGYSGWSVGQLEEEIEEKSWLTVEADPQLIFHADSDTIWKASLHKLGGDYEMMANFPIDPQLN
ncbi:MAG: YqgE/AlgH family protein [Chitinophagaceae bacterium]|nr:YqgE/AlgH family protein [Chitinophagaceae bacterium]